MKKEQQGEASFNSVQYNPNTITKEEADKYVAKWKTGEYQIVPATSASKETILLLDSFLFSIDDFRDYMLRVDAYNADPAHKDDKITGTICRMGIKENPIQGAEPKEVPALFFQPVIGFSKDPLEAGSYINNLEPLQDDPDKDKVSAIYDFSYPCPPTCAPEKK